jgi:hypothetical protein
LRMLSAAAGGDTFEPEHAAPFFSLWAGVKLPPAQAALARR